MHRLIQGVVFFILCGLLYVNGYAWSRPGHMIVAAVAYRELKNANSPALDKINELLRSHPAYPTWKAEYAAAPPDVTEMFPPEAYYFMRAAVWADDVRSPSGNPEHKENWHFINFPLRLQPNSIDFNTETPPDNILVAFQKAVSDLKNSHASKTLKAKKLSWIFHLVGDVHQPLHTVKMLSNGLPGGDLGGNLVCVSPAAGFSDNLHSYWDNLLGRTQKPLTNAAQSWLDAAFYSHNMSSAGFNGEPKMKDWAKESADLALSNAYRFNNETVTFKKKSHDKCPDFTSSELLPDNYSREAKKIAQKRVVMAGYRLAGALKTSFQ